MNRTERADQLVRALETVYGTYEDPKTPAKPIHATALSLKQMAELPAIGDVGACVIFEPLKITEHPSELEAIESARREHFSTSSPMSSYRVFTVDYLVRLGILPKPILDQMEHMQGFRSDWYLDVVLLTQN